MDDAAELLKKYSPNEPATVIGNSSGAIISLKVSDSGHRPFSGTAFVLMVA